MLCLPVAITASAQSTSDVFVAVRRPFSIAHAPTSPVCLPARAPYASVSCLRVSAHVCTYRVSGQVVCTVDQHVSMLLFVCDCRWPLLLLHTVLTVCLLRHVFLACVMRGCLSFFLVHGFSCQMWPVDSRRSRDTSHACPSTSLVKVRHRCGRHPRHTRKTCTALGRQDVWWLGSQIPAARQKASSPFRKCCLPFPKSRLRRSGRTLQCLTSRPFAKLKRPGFIWLTRRLITTSL